MTDAEECLKIIFIIILPILFLILWEISIAFIDSSLKDIKGANILQIIAEILALATYVLVAVWIWSNLKIISLEESNKLFNNNQWLWVINITIPYTMAILWKFKTGYFPAKKFLSETSVITSIIITIICLFTKQYSVAIIIFISAILEQFVIKFLSDHFKTFEKYKTIKWKESKLKKVIQNNS